MLLQYLRSHAITNLRLYGGWVHERPILPVPTEVHAQLAAQTFRMLADPTRVKILWALLQEEASVTALAEHIGSSTTAVSQHLAKLRLAGLVDSRRVGTFIYYSAQDPHVHRLLAETLSRAEHETGVASGADHVYRA
ncbi:winged helix-turn-helix transcriptional regulator [Ornithinimicrobium ciconiae]|uniref:Winged helix-turn-helix transcriptional regulator n=1 Tax=Ornithinimicrobium ciconiae TaxID=2594265 RepID=A0A516GEL8_9MICO|nr:winged helix-turn-helix transcriptional regulator [Ornithinimicrobium ciconiae]